MSHRDSFIKKNRELKKPLDLFNVGFLSIITVTPFSVTGGTPSSSGGYNIRTINSTQSMTVTGSGNPEIMLVAGGGSGGGSAGGGGGGGEVIKFNAVALTGGVYTVMLGEEGIRVGGSLLGLLVMVL